MIILIKKNKDLEEMWKNIAETRNDHKIVFTISVKRKIHYMFRNKCQEPTKWLTKCKIELKKKVLQDVI